MKKENIEEIEIEEFKFNKDGIDELSRTWYNNWPVVYILNNQKEAYIGETNNSRRRMKQHKENKKRGTIKQVRIISNRKFNESAVKNIEALLIRLMHADKKFILQNETEMNKEDDYEYKNNYYQKAMYEKMIYQIWNKLEDKRIVESKIEDLKNTNIFKYSPYTSLNQEQKDIAKEISENILNAEAFFIEGLPGTGKTILAIYLAKLLTEQNYKVGLVISMTSLRNTVSQVFKNTKGLKANMVIGPSQVFDEKYDVLIVDEAHRLRMKKGLRSSKSYDKRCDEFKKECKQKNKEIPNKITELDWIGLRAERKILFYDEKQKVRPTDISKKEIEEFKKDTVIKEYTLHSQMRMIDCEDYMDFVEQLLEINDSKYYEFNIGNYEFEIYDNFEKMYSKIREKDKKYKLSRMISGISDKWDKTDNSEYDIWIQGKGYKWNSEVKEWINSDNAINEIGCIHTVQGYDLNYAGVIFGKEISYDEENKKIIIIPENYQDAKGKAGISNNQTELKRYILNIYRVLLTRGIRGTFVYAMDENFNRYLKRVARKIRNNEDRKISYMKAADESQDYKLEKKKKCKR